MLAKQMLVSVPSKESYNEENFFAVILPKTVTVWDMHLIFLQLPFLTSILDF